MLSRLTALALAAALLTSCSTAQDAFPKQPDDPRPGLDPVAFLSLPSLGNVSVSSDGRFVLLTQTRTDWVEDERVSEVRTLTPDGLTLSGLPDDPDRMVWSPDGSLLAIDVRPEDSRTDQIMLYDRDAQSIRTLTSHPTSVRDIAWSPDGRYILFLADDAPDEIEAAQRRTTHPVEPYFETVDHRHLWRVDVATGETKRETGGNWSVRTFDVAESGQVLIRRSDALDLDANYGSEVWVATNIDASFVRQTRNDWPESGATFSPDGSQFAYVARVKDGSLAYVQERIFVQTVGDGEARDLLGSQRFEVEDLDWRTGGEDLILEINAGPSSALIRVDVSSGRQRTLFQPQGEIGSWQYVPSADAVFLVLTESTSPGDLWRVDVETGRSQRLTTTGRDAVSAYASPRETLIRWTAPDGQEVEGFYTPPLRSTSTPAPLVVQPHGGPRTSDKYGDAWAAGSFVPVLSAMGYGVLKVNYRGGTGYGDAFFQGITEDYFANAEADILSGIDHLVALGVADPEDVSIMGWSAGAHLVNRLITQTDRFRAAVSGAGAVDFAVHHLTSDTRGARSLLFGAEAWDEGAVENVFWPQSLLPLLPRVTTPTLILSGEDDERVHPSNSIMLYHALRLNEVETELYLFPGVEHGLRKPSHQLFRINLILDWFAQHRGVPRPAFAIAPDGSEEAAKLAAGASRLVERGTGAYLFTAWDGPPLPVFYHVPESATPDSPIVFVAHGTRRNSSAYRDQWIPIADARGVIVLSVEFSNADFPGARSYNLGNILDRDDAPQPENVWSFSAIEPIFDEAVAALGSNQRGYYLYGHSAGSQFTHRYLFLKPDARVIRFLPANAGWYTFPSLETDWPYGLKGSGVTEDMLKAALQRDVVVLLGDQDTDPLDPTLRTAPEAMAQGPQRFARGQSFFAAAEAEARRLGVPFGWRLEVVEGSGHNNDLMAKGAIEFVD